MPSLPDSDPKKWVMPPHTKAKHDILVGYLNAWFPILSTWNGRVLVLDGFAGRGRYVGGEAGSPVLVLESLLDHDFFSRMKCQFVFLFVEADEDNYASLVQELDELKARRDDWPANVSYQVECEVFEESSRRIRETLAAEGGRLAPTFAFLDPFGWNGISMHEIRDLLSGGKHEVLINFMVESVNRFLKHPGQVDNMSRLFGCDAQEIIDDLPDDDRVEYLKNRYADQLKKVAGFKHVFQFGMVDQRGKLTYYLTFGTRHPSGVKAMKAAMWKVDPSGEYTFSDRTHDELVLFGDDPNLNPLRVALLGEYLLEDEWLTCEEIYEFTLLKTPYLEKHARQVLKEWEREHRIAVDRPHPKAQFSAPVLINFQP